jgi:hypothetical protein
MKKLTLLAGLTAGYVLGTRDGRERYEQIKERAAMLWSDPKVRGNAAAARDLVQEKAPDLAGKVFGLVGKGEAVRSTSDPGPAPSPVTTTSGGAA